MSLINTILVPFAFLLISSAFGSDVLELTDSNFQDGVKDKEIILVEFFAPWCGHCKKLAPEYEKAATTLKKNDPPIPIAKVDCVGEGKESCSKHGVSGYPTLKIFRDGEISQDYDGPRDAAGIAAYMKKISGPASVTLTDSDHLEKKLAAAEDILVVGFLSEGSKGLEQFLKAADAMRSDYQFSHTTDAAVMEKAGHKDVIVLYRPKHLHAKFEDAVVTLPGEGATKDSIKTFVSQNEAGLVGQIKPAKEGSFKKPLLVVYYQVDWVRNLKGSRYWRNRVARVAKKLVGKLTFAIAAKDDYGNKISDWGWKMEGDSVHAVAFDFAGNIYKMTADKFSVDTLEAFANDFLDGKLKPYIKSEPVPESNDGPVKVVVGETFNEIVKDETKDVLIEFYAPWCGHCKKLTPIYEELGEKLKDNKDIVIAKMDATLNDAPPEFKVSGFPTMYWAPMGNKANPVKYQGGREVNDFVDYIKKHATNPVDIPDKKSKKKKAKEDL